MLLNRERAIEVMERHGLDVLVATSPENVYYVTDYAREPPFLTGRDHNWAILPRDPGSPTSLLVNEFELPWLAQSSSSAQQIRVQTGIDTVLPPADSLSETGRAVRSLMLEGRSTGSPDRLAALIDALGQLGVAAGRIGCDEATMRDILLEQLPQAVLSDAQNVFREIRVVKTPDEIALMRRSASVLDHALSLVASSIVAGVTCRELISTFRIAMERQGAYGSHMTYGGAEFPWLGFSDLSYRLQDGDVLFIDPAGTFRHYWSDIGRSAVVGNRPTARFDEYYGALQECHRAVVPQLRPGNSFRQLEAIARETVSTAIPNGFLPLFHSIGIEQYDHPSNRAEFGGGDLRLEAGMTINFESLYFELGWTALQLEDTYLITEDGPEQLTDRAQERLSTP